MGVGAKEITKAGIEVSKVFLCFSYKVSLMISLTRRSKLLTLSVSGCLLVLY